MNNMAAVKLVGSEVPTMNAGQDAHRAQTRLAIESAANRRSTRRKACLTNHSTAHARASGLR